MPRFDTNETECALHTVPAEKPKDSTHCPARGATASTVSTAEATIAHPRSSKGERRVCSTTVTEKKSQNYLALFAMNTRTGEEGSVILRSDSDEMAIVEMDTDNLQCQDTWAHALDSSINVDAINGPQLALLRILGGAEGGHLRLTCGRFNWIEFTTPDISTAVTTTAIRNAIASIWGVEFPKDAVISMEKIIGRRADYLIRRQNKPARHTTHIPACVRLAPRDMLGYLVEEGQLVFRGAKARIMSVGRATEALSIVIGRADCCDTALLPEVPDTLVASLTAFCASRELDGIDLIDGLLTRFTLEQPSVVDATPTTEFVAFTESLERPAEWKPMVMPHTAWTAQYPQDVVESDSEAAFRGFGLLY